MVSAPRSPLSPLHCARPVSMVTGLSDRWPSQSYGVLNSPTASPYPPPALHGALLPLGVDVSPLPRLSHSLFVRPPSASDCLLQIYSKADNKLERGLPPAAAQVPSSPDGQSVAGHTHTHTALWSIVSAPAESKTAGLATHQRNGVMSFPHPPEVCSSVTSCWLMQCVCPQ